MDLCWQSNVSVFNMMSRLVITFLPRSTHLLISWLQSPSAVILEVEYHVNKLILRVSSAQSLSHVRLFATPWTAACQDSLSLTNSWSMLTHVHQVGDGIQPSHPLMFPCLPAFNRSQHQGLFQWVSSSHQVAKYWSFSFSISPSNEYSGLISFRTDWVDLLLSKRHSRVFS